MLLSLLCSWNFGRKLPSTVPNQAWVRKEVGRRKDKSFLYIFYLCLFSEIESDYVAQARLELTIHLLQY